MKNNLTANSTINILSTSSAVWDALTKPELIRQYFYGTEAISDWREGSPIIFKGEWDGKSYEDKGTILIAEPDKLFRYAYWSSMSGIEDKPENYVTITYELFEDGGITTLDITKENFPDEELKMHSIQKWRKVLNGLKALLEKSDDE
ncbi:MAG: SRPBCC domain-containing protein [Ferruginibacter sp.]